MSHRDLVRGRCPACEADSLRMAANAGQRVPCPRCRYRFAFYEPAPFGPADWVLCDDPELLKDAVELLRPPRSPRRSRLLACAIAARGFADRGDAELLRAVRTGIDLAEGRCDDGTRRWVERELNQLAALRAEVPPWLSIAWLCVAEPGVRLAFSHAVAPEIVADCYREVIANPFVYGAVEIPAAAPDVFGLASEIAATHRVERFAELSGALARSGCTDDRILDHLSTDQPHAVGCWALDLVLGRA